MAAVVFAFGQKPGVEQTDALEIETLLGRSRNMAALRAASKIGGQARRDSDRGGSSEHLDLNDDEMIELYSVLTEPFAIPDRVALRRLRVELAAALTRI